MQYAILQKTISESYVVVINSVTKHAEQFNVKFLVKKNEENGIFMLDGADISHATKISVGIII